MKSKTRHFYYTGPKEFTYINHAHIAFISPNSLIKNFTKMPLFNKCARKLFLLLLKKSPEIWCYFSGSLEKVLQYNYPLVTLKPPIHSLDA